VLHQITSGLDHLQKKQVIHCQLKPKNILVSIPDGGVSPLMKLANFGMLRRAISEDGNPVTLWKLGGSKGWLPAEAYVETLFTTEMDVYVLGLIFCYSLNKGCHPFGEDKEERIIRMKKSEPMTLIANQLQNVTDPEKVFQLINRMLNTESNQRPTASDVLQDAFFNPSVAAESNFVASQPPEPQGLLILKTIFICYNIKQDLIFTQ
jgi:serine/threonine protein kinase